MKQPKILEQTKIVKQSKILQEFKDFAVKGNVIDMAVGIIIGGAFGKIVSSFVADVIMPPLGLLIGGVNFTNLSISLKSAFTDANGVAHEAVTLNYGNFLQVTFDFLIVAFAIFFFIRMLNKLKSKEEPAPVPTAEPAPTKEEILLTEIRDILKNKN
ncbi:MAG: large-conductance mechanosensitive channel protein MscL [Prevotellaceae bacterium]|jgi:large conductance mechanosensitive channel|nr:large-conductance mechanosensitive channel protein MscL [Prevotellaceae bacterium]